MAVLRYDFHSHPKILGLSNAAVGVFAKALSYASANLTDGFVPSKPCREWDRNRTLFGQLCDAGLVRKVTGGYIIDSYLEHNPSKTQVEAKREQQRQKMRELRQARKAKREPSQASDVTGVVNSIGKDKEQTPSSTNDSPTPAPFEGFTLNGRHIRLEIPDIGQSAA